MWSQVLKKQALLVFQHSQHHQHSCALIIRRITLIFAHSLSLRQPAKSPLVNWMVLRLDLQLITPSLRGEVGLDVIKALKTKGFKVAADVQGFVRVLSGQNLNDEPWTEMQEVLSNLDILKSDAVEAEYLTGESDIHNAAQTFSSMGPKEIVLTHKDGLLILADGKFHHLNFYPQNLSGRSGRGDTCIGSYVSMRQSMSSLEAGIWAAAVTSLKMEKASPFDRPISDIEDLIHTRYNHGSHH